MTNSRDWENGGPKPDRRGVERASPLQREWNVIGKKLAMAVVALLTGVVMLNDHEALARGAGGEGASERGFRGSDLVKGSKEAGYGGRRSGHLAGGRRGFDQRGQVGDPYWAPCNNYDSYGADSCE
jgi:hypothetical protein